MDTLLNLLKLIFSFLLRVFIIGVFALSKLAESLLAGLNELLNNYLNNKT